MDDATVRRMFEPFFTTKPIGKGTGLGLATTQAIVRDHGGFAAVRSEHGTGTTFSLFVPARPAAAIALDAKPRDASPLWRRRDSTLLVVDDDHQVRIATARVLKSAGFAVETALALIAERAFDLVLLDVSMPGMSGAQTRRHLRERAPSLPVVFLTGYTFESEYGDVVLEKPLPADELVSRIDQVLSRSEPRT
jgi:CheY-like chemotaxis protein